jgi:hypothetical protein
MLSKFASLNLFDLPKKQQIHSLAAACVYFRKPEVEAVASAFFSALLLKKNKSLIDAFGIREFGVADWTVCPQKDVFVAAALEFTDVARLVLEHSTVESVPDEIKLRFKAVAAAYIEAFEVYRQYDLPIMCGQIEAALEAMYAAQARPTTGHAELEELAFHIGRARTKYQSLMPDRLALFDAKRAGV